MRAFTLAFGVVCYVLFVVTFLYQMGFLLNFGVPKDINDGTVLPFAQAAIINIVLSLWLGARYGLSFPSRLSAASSC